MIRVGIPLIGGQNWMGGYNYLLNMARSISAHGGNDFSLVVAYGEDVSETMLLPFRHIERVTVVQSAAFNEENKASGLRNALLNGLDSSAWQVFAKQNVSVVFEPARFFGWRLPVPAVAWIPDFQHRHMPHLFSRSAYWKREIGFRAQIMAGRRILLSSKDAESDCIYFYPRAIGKTVVASFAARIESAPSLLESKEISAGLGFSGSFFHLPNQMWRHKNHSCVIDALTVLKSQGHELKIAITGKEADDRAPDYVDALRKKVRDSGLQDQFYMLGMQPYKTIQALMAACDAVINPSFFEGWSTTVEEAKSIGTPLILSDIAVHREQAGTNARYFDPRSPSDLAECLLQFSAMSMVERGMARSAAALETEENEKIFVASLRRAFGNRHLTR
jgi:glycosyltransferase involved in cell wall biosynthesis